MLESWRTQLSSVRFNRLQASKIWCNPIQQTHISHNRQFFSTSWHAYCPTLLQCGRCRCGRCWFQYWLSGGHRQHYHKAMKPCATWNLNMNQPWWLLVFPMPIFPNNYYVIRNVSQTNQTITTESIELANWNKSKRVHDQNKWKQGEQVMRYWIDAGAIFKITGTLHSKVWT